MSGSLGAFRVLALGLVALTVVACGGDGGSGGSDTGEAALSPTARVYQVRAEVVRLPEDGSPEIYLHHESIADFVDPRGTVVGMDSMTMPFPVEGKKVVQGVAVGDKVTMTLMVDWMADRPVQVQALEPLPPDTVLDFEALARDENAVEVGGTWPPD